jgi:hypothetical protein
VNEAVTRIRLIEGIVSDKFFHLAQRISSGAYLPDNSAVLMILRENFGSITLLSRVCRRGLRDLLMYILKSKGRPSAYAWDAWGRKASTTFTAKWHPINNLVFVCGALNRAALSRIGRNKAE